LLVGGEEAADASAAASALATVRRRGAAGPPTQVHHLQGRNVNRMTETAGNATLRVANVTMPPEGVDLNGAIRGSITINFSTVDPNIISRNGGGSNNSTNNILAVPSVSFINPYGQQGMEVIMPAINDLMEHYTNQSTSNDTNVPPSENNPAMPPSENNPVAVNNNVTLIENVEQHETYKAKSKKKKATVQTEEQIVQSLGSAVSSSVIPFPV